MFPAHAAMAEDRGFGAAGVLQGVGEDGEAVERALGVDGGNQLRNDAEAEGEDGWSGGVGMSSPQPA
jgi:hypothetical protein